MRNLTVTFSDGYVAPVIEKGNYPGVHSHIIVGLTKNSEGTSRILFIHDTEPIGAKMLEAHDPWIKDVYEHVSLRQVQS